MDYNHLVTTIAGLEDLDSGIVSPNSIYAQSVIAQHDGQEGWWQDTKLAFRKGLDQPLRGIPIISAYLETTNKAVRPIADRVLGDVLAQLTSHPDSSVKSEAKGLVKSIGSDNFDLNLFNKDYESLLKALIKHSEKEIDKCKGGQITAEAKRAMKEVGTVNNKFNSFSNQAFKAIEKVRNKK